MLCQSGNYLNCIKHKCVHNSFAKSIPAAIESYYYHSRGTYSLIDKFICPSRFMANTAHKAGIDENKTIVLHNFSDKKASASKRSSTSEPYALYFGRLSVEKGIGTLVQAAKELPGIKFVFAGTGPLEDLCKNIPNIEYAGFKSGKELSDLIENAEFSICPSECHENCPMTVAESVSLGTPVIGSDLGGIPELIKSGKTGIVFEAGNKEALKAAIQKLYSDKELSSEMAQNCRGESFNDIEKYTERLSEIYSDLISKMIKLVSFIISKIKHREYKVDENITSADLCGILAGRLAMLIRGAFKKSASKRPANDVYRQKGFHKVQRAHQMRQRSYDKRRLQHKRALPRRC